MDGKTLARIGAIIFVAIALTATALEFVREPEAPETTTSQPAVTHQNKVDPLRQELRRCQALGAAATGDTACLTAWSDNRQRFLGQTPERR